MVEKTYREVIADADSNDPVGTLQRYLRRGKRLSARVLAQKAVILMEPVVWPVK